MTSSGSPTQIANGPGTAAETIFLSAIEDELHDAKRVQNDGQEEDLRMALEMVIRRVTEMTTMLRSCYSRMSELEVELGVSQSNLKILMANNEMLEDALKRDKSVGWRRSVPPNTKSYFPIIAENGEEGVSSTPPSSQSNSVTSSPVISAQAPRGTSPENEGASTTGSKFFNKFRFSSPSLSRATTPRPSTPPNTAASLSPNASHLSSASMPSLPASLNGSPVDSSQITSLQSRITSLEEQIASLTNQTTALQAAKEEAVKAKEESVKEKQTLEAELENLSQALFEEANKMVSTERIKHHETECLFEEQIRELEEEKQALKSAMRIVERENELLRTKTAHLPASPTDEAADSPTISFTQVLSNGLVHSEEDEGEPQSPLSRSSSVLALKSRPSSRNTSIHPSPLPLNLSPAEIPLPLSDDEDDSGGLKTARPPIFSPRSPLSPYRQSRAFGPLETLPISSQEVLKMLKAQGQQEDEEEELSALMRRRVEDAVASVHPVVSQTFAALTQKFLTPSSSTTSLPLLDEKVKGEEEPAAAVPS